MLTDDLAWAAVQRRDREHRIRPQQHGIAEQPGDGGNRGGGQRPVTQPEGGDEAGRRGQRRDHLSVLDDDGQPIGRDHEGGHRAGDHPAPPPRHRAEQQRQAGVE